MNLSHILDLVGQDSFKESLKKEIASIDPGQLPLQQGLAHSSYVSKAPFSPVILSIKNNESSLIIKTGIFYTGIIAGCSCADDPSPTDEQNEYCELLIEIEKTHGESKITLIP